MYTFGDKEKGKLGRPITGTNLSWEVKKFVASDENTEMENVKIGYVSDIADNFTVNLTAVSHESKSLFFNYNVHVCVHVQYMYSTCMCSCRYLYHSRY